MNIEVLATSAVKASLCKTDRLNPFVAEGDKEPVWDGNVYIHEDSKKNKKNLKRVPVQVKGKRSDGEISNTVLYRIKVSDLESYQRDGGVIFFVVYLGSDGNARQIYYTPLYPIKISELLKNKQGNASISVSFQKFPEDNNEKTAVFLDFYAHAKKQASFAGKTLPTITELEKQGILEGLTFHYPGVNPNASPYSFPQLAEGKEMIIYANVKNLPIQIPVEYHEQVSHLMLAEELNLPVYANGKKYYDSYKALHQADSTTIRVGNCLTLKLPHANAADRRTTITLTTKGSLNQRLEALPFIDDIIKAKSVVLNGASIPVILEPEKLEQIHYSRLSTELESLRRIKKVLDQLHVSKDLDMDKFTKRDYWLIDKLVGAIDEEDIIYGTNQDLPPLVVFEIANLFLVLISEKQSDGGYRFWDYFNKYYPLKAIDENDMAYPVSQFSILRKDDFQKIDNMDLNAVAESFIRAGKNSVNEAHANIVLLEILKAYDDHGVPALLDAAERLNNWILEFDNAEIHVLNQMQIIARRRKLSFEEKQKLTKIATESSMPVNKTGAFLLLQEWTEMEKSMQLITEEEKNVFLSSPIYNLYQSQEAN
ncbi:MAG: hypothetical protein IKO68_08810 [Oscillospiraceae bacterium]|nr:hypothetical protein [Oscillospiraceae bacterium]